MNTIIVILIILIILCVLCIYSIGIVEHKRVQKRRIRFNTPRWHNTTENLMFNEPANNDADNILQLDMINRIHNIPQNRVRVVDNRFIREMGQVLGGDDDRVVIRLLNNANNILIDQVLLNNQLFDEELFLLGIFENIGIDTRQFRNQNIERRLNEVDPNLPKPEQREEFLDNSRVYVDNPQNVHDNAINANMHQIMLRVIEGNIGRPLPSKQEIINTFKDIPHAVSVINTCNDTNTVVALNGMTDLSVLQHIYLRCHHPKNDKKAMLTALGDNLKNCVENGHIVCVVGRVTRIVSTLILLDFDEQNWNMKLVDDYKEEILNKTKNIIQEVATLALNTTLDAPAREYLIKEREPTDLVSIPEIKGDTEEDLVEIMRKCIIEMIDEYGTNKYDYQFKPNVLDIIKSENLAVFSI